MLGAVVSDRVCLVSENDCVDNFPFFLADSETGPGEFSGIFGVGPPTSINQNSFVSAMESS
jgi:hypothetical protein